MLIESIEVTEITPCMAEKEKFKATTVASASLDEILPYLNAVLDNADYQQNINALTFKKGIIGFTLMGNEINVTRFINNTELYAVLDWIQELINNTNDQKATIVPNLAGQKKIPLLQILKLLPKTNCRQCGQASCTAFASQLNAHEARVSQCLPLQEADNKNAKNVLLSFFKE